MLTRLYLTCVKMNSAVNHVYWNLFKISYHFKIIVKSVKPTSNPKFYVVCETFLLKLLFLITLQ